MLQGSCPVRVVRAAYEGEYAEVFGELKPLPRSATWLIVHY